jgi:DNA-binding NarL/FixJ family response regulator
MLGMTTNSLQAMLTPHEDGTLVVLDPHHRDRDSRHLADAAGIRVLIADAHGLVRAGFRVLLEEQRHISVIAEAADGEQAVALARRLRPDVVLIDAALAGLDGAHAIRAILSTSSAAVMVLTSSEDEDGIFAALRAGASGLLVKDTEPADLVRGVELLARGGASLSPSVTRRLIAEYASRPEPSHPASELLDELTAREREVMGLVAHGLSNDEIAEQLVLSPATAKTHVSRAMIKLHARDRAQLVVYAYESGLAQPRAVAPERRALALA